MAANFAQMNQQRQPVQGRQAGVQIHEAIFRHLSAQNIPVGWQAGVLIQERVANVWNIVSGIRLLGQGSPQNLQKMIEMGVNWEREMFEKSPDKDSYKAEVEKKQIMLRDKRNQSQGTLQQQINQQAQAQAQAQQAQAQQMMNQNAMQGQIQRGLLQPGQQGFQHLQHQMQASPLPGQNPQLNMGIPNDVSQGMGNHQFPVPMQQPQQQNFTGRPMNAQHQLSPQENELVIQMANTMASRLSADEKNNIRARLQTVFDAQTMQNYQARNVDPVVVYFRNQAHKQLRENQNRLAQAQAQMTMQGQNMPTSAPMQLQRSMNPSPMNGQPQPGQMNGNQDFSYIGNNMDNIAVQQQQGVIAQEAGQMVVPASGAPRNGTPQPGMPGQMNANIRAQQMFNAQQAHRERLSQQGAQPQPSPQQSQLQARQNMQAKAQQLPLGQGANLGPGSMPQQSPAMGTQNNLLRTPSQQMNEPAMNPNTQFGQPLDPRFMHGNQRPVNTVNGVNAAAFARLPLDIQQKTAALPPDKLNEVMAKWNEQQQMNANAQGRPGMPMQVNNQVRPGQQMPQPGQLNQSLMNQFNNANPGQRPTPAMLAAMNQQQMVRSGQNPLQQRSGPQATPFEQRVMMQMDSTDFPPNLHNSGNMPRNIPPEIKKWGPLKQWAQQNPNLGPEVLNSIKQVQRLHYQQIVRSKNQQQPNAAIGIPPGPQGGQMMPAVPQGMPAPVAPMGQNPMQISPGSIRQPTQQEINSFRSQHSERMGNASDDQIKGYLLKQYVAQMRQQQNQQMMQQASNLGNAQPQQAMQIAQPSQSAPVPQPKPEAPPQNANRTRPQPARPPPQSSPPQPAKNLKRGNSDDVVEVPPPSRPVAPPQVQKQPGQPQRLPPEKVAQLSPENRAKYEELVRRAQQPKQQQLSPADMEKWKVFQKEETEYIQKNYREIPLDAETRAVVEKSLRELLMQLMKIGKVLPRWYNSTRDDSRTRMFIRIQIQLRQQFLDTAFTQFKETFSITKTEIEQARGLFNSIMKDLYEMSSSNIRKGEAVQAPEPVAAPTAPLNAANLEQQQKQLNLMHQRSNSRSQVPPAAPTTSQPPFQFGAPSPHGTPVYTGKPPAITRENLHIPRKKQKQNAPATAQSTPGSTSSPQVKQGPEVKKEAKAPAKPTWTCSEPECDRHNVGFDSEEALRQHTQSEHIRPLEDPKRFLLETLASMTHLDGGGRPKIEEPATTMATGLKPGQTPKDTPAATPMHRQVSMNRQASATSKTSPQAKGKDLAKNILAKAHAVKESQHVAREILDPWAASTIDPNDLAQTFQAFETGAGGAISDMSVYRSITPNDTPESSKDGVSEPNSDISDGVALDINLSIFDDGWQPFAGSETFTGTETNDAKVLFGTDINNGEYDHFIMEDPQPSSFQWDDSVNPATLDAPFSFDTSLYSMNVD